MFDDFDQRPAWEGLSAYEAPETEAEEDVGQESPEEEQDYPDLEVTYVLFPEEPGFDQVYEQAADWLEMPGGMLEIFKIYPVNIA